MNILDYIFKSKKQRENDTAEPVVKKEVPKAVSQITVINAEEIDSLRSHADKGYPILVMGGDFSGSQVFPVIKPSDVAQKVFRGKTYPVVTVDRITLGTYPPFTFWDGMPEEERKIREEKANQDYREAKAEKEYYTQHQHEPGFEPHRYQKPKGIAALPSVRKEEVSGTPNPESTPKQTTIAKPKSLGFEPTKQSVPKWNDDEEDEPEDMKTFVTPFRYINTMPKSETLYWKYLQAKKALPPYDMFGTPSDLPEGAVTALKKIKAEVQNLLDRANALMKQEDWHGAVNLYQNLLMNKYWEPEPYYALIEIYERIDRHEDAQAVRQAGIYAFNNVQRRMRNELLESARKIDAEDLARTMMEKGEKVVYGLGLYTVYDPFPCIKQWEQEMLLNS